MTRAPEPIPAAAAGTIEGFVYWDAKAISHLPASACSGLAITVSVGSSSGGPLEAYKPLATVSNNFKYVGQVKTFLAGGTVVVYDVCTYGYNHVPVGPDLQVKLAITQPTAFSPTANPQFSVVGPVKIINAQCNMLPRITNPTASDLTAHWGSCQNMAYGVNFAMLPSAHLMSGGVSETPGTRQPMLSGAPRQGMLAPGTSSGILNGSGQTPQGQGGGSPNPAGKVELNPQPLPPRTEASGRTRKVRVSAQARAGTKLASPVQSQKIVNPKAALHGADIIAVLRTQRQAAEAEASQMKLSLRPGGLQAQPSKTMSATGGAMRTSHAAAPAPVATAALPPSNGSSSAASRFATLPAGSIPGIALQCGHDPAMRILTVNGSPNPVTFTQDAKFNFYTITGCSFGDAGPNSKVSIYYQGTFHQDFQVEEWSDNGIKLHLDPNLAGVDDQNNLTIVVQRADGKQTTKNGFKFYAARDTVLLRSIPKTSFSLDGFRPDAAATKNWKLTYTSGSSASVVPHLTGLTAEAHWDVDYDSNGNLTGGSDIFDLSHLHSTFVLDSASMEGVNLSCTDPHYNDFVTSKNNWGIDWYGASGVKVNWQAQSCEFTPGSCGGAFQGDCFESQPETNYGVNVWVTGPRGVDPWTGKPKS